MKIKKLGALLVSAVLCAGMAAPAFAFEGEAAPVEQPVLPEVVEDIVTVTDETSGALTPEGNLTLVDDYHTSYSDGSGQQFITLVSKSGATFYLVIDRNAKGQQTVHFMNLVDEADLLALMEEDAADAYTAEKEAAAQAEQDRLKAEEEAKKAAEEAAASGTETPKENKVTKIASGFLGVVVLIALAAGGGFYALTKQMVQELSKRAAEIHSGTVDASVDNMLCVTNDGRKIGLDVRLMNPMLPDDPNSKLNVCVQNVLKIWEEGKDQKLTQLLFCDLSTPKNDGNFNVYDDIRKKLVAAGVPENEIEFIHNADTEAKKAALFSKVRSGDVRVLLGSTAKMGAGTNVQSRLVAVHHLDVGWKPSDMTQRNGRIIRQGNMNKEVKVFNYVTEGTFDSYLFQTLENKQRFISQIMTSKSPVRSCEDVDEQALSYAEIKALCAGNPLIKEKMDLDVQVAKLKVLKADHQSQKFRLQDKLLTKFPADIQETNAHIAGLKADAQLAAAHPQGKEEFCGMTIRGVTYDEKKTAGERLVLACSELPNAEEKVIGSYRGFELSLRFDTFRTEYQALLKGQRKYTVPLGTDPLGNIIRLDNSLNNFPERITAAENELDTLHQQQAAAQIEVEKPFPQEEELAEKSARLAELNAQLDVDEKSHEPEQDEEEQEDEPRRPSVLAALEEKSDKPEPVKPFRSYYDKDGDAR